MTGKSHAKLKSVLVFVLSVVMVLSFINPSVFATSSAVEDNGDASIENIVEAEQTEEEVVQDEQSKSDDVESKNEGSKSAKEDAKVMKKDAEPTEEDVRTVGNDSKESDQEEIDNEEITGKSASKQTVLKRTTKTADQEEYSLTFHSGEGQFIDGSNTNVVTYGYVENSEMYSHTPNISNAGIQSGNYGDNMNTNEVVRWPGASSLHIVLTYGGESPSYDWVSLWEGSHPDYTAANNYSSGLKFGNNTNGKYGGTNGTTVEGDVQGNTVTFAFKSDGGGVGNGYGYYAVITAFDENGDQITSVPSLQSGNYKVPKKEGLVFLGWHLAEDLSDDVITNINLLNYNSDTDFYAEYGDSDFDISVVYLDSRHGTTVFNQDTPYDFTSNTLTGTVTLQVNIFGEELSKDYAPGELEFKVYGFEKFGLQNVKTLGNLFTFEHHTGTFDPNTRTVVDDYYVVRNKTTMAEGTNVDALLQLVYTYSNSTKGCPFDGSSGTVYAEFYEDKTNEIPCEFHIGKQAHKWSGNASQFDIRSTDGFGDDAGDYYWMRTGYNSDTTSGLTRAPLDVVYGAYETVITGLPEGYKIYQLDYNGGRLYEYVWSEEKQGYVADFVHAVNDNYASSGSYMTGYIVIGAPKDSTNVGDVLNFQTTYSGRYPYKYGSSSYVDEDFTMLWQKDHSLVVKDTVQVTPGDFANFSVSIYSDNYFNGNVISAPSHYMCYGYNHDIGSESAYRIKFGADGLYTIDTEDNIYELQDSEYYIRGIQMPKLQDKNQLRVGETWDLYVRHKDSDQFVLYSDTPYNAGQTVNIPETDIVEVYILSSPITSAVYSGGSSSNSLRLNYAHTTVPQGYEVNGYMCTYGFLDMFPGDYDPATDSDAERTLIASSVDDYTTKVGNTDLVQMNLPARDLEKYGKYLYRKTDEEKIRADRFTGMINVRDNLVGDYQGYSDFLLTAYSGYSSGSSTSATDINGDDFYVVLPEQVQVIGTPEDIKNSLLSDTFKTRIANEDATLKRFVANTDQFDSLDEYVQFLYDSLSVDIREDDGKTIVHMHWEFPEPLILPNFSGNQPVYAEIQIPVRIYDVDVLDYGQELETFAYSQPILNSGTEFYNYNANGGPSAQSAENIIISHANRDSTSECHGKTWPDTIDVDNDGNTTERFNEFRSYIVYSKPLEALQELSKLTQTERNTFSMKPKKVNSGEEYSYRLRTRTASTGMTNVIMYDYLEQHAPAGVDGYWRGSFQGVDLTRSQTQGFVPTVYCSTKADPGSLDEDSSWQEYSDSIDKSTIKSLAFDYGDQIIPSNHIASVDVIMRAPENDSEYYAYNNYNMQWQRVDMATGRVYPDLETFTSNVTILSLNAEISETVVATVVKNWVDDNNQTITPEETSLNVELYRKYVSDTNGDEDIYTHEKVQDIVLTASGDWSKSISGLPRFHDSGAEYEYYAVEPVVPNGYEKNENGLTITNKRAGVPVPTGVKYRNDIVLILLTMATFAAIIGIRRRKSSTK